MAAFWILLDMIMVAFFVVIFSDPAYATLPISVLDG
jgi:hypothetical protein